MPRKTRRRLWRWRSRETTVNCSLLTAFKGHCTFSVACRTACHIYGAQNLSQCVHKPTSIILPPRVAPPPNPRVKKTAGVLPRPMSPAFPQRPRFPLDPLSFSHSSSAARGEEDRGNKLLCDLRSLQCTAVWQLQGRLPQRWEAASATPQTESTQRH